jgi:hypothetical protein
LNFRPDAPIPLAKYNVYMATNPKRPRDINQLAKLIGDITTGDKIDHLPTKKAIAGRAGGLKGGKTRMDALSPEDRSKLAKKAAEKRWEKAVPSRTRPKPD